MRTFETFIAEQSNNCKLATVPVYEADPTVKESVRVSDSGRLAFPLSRHSRGAGWKDNISLL
jgi:hypothetical protein